MVSGERPATMADSGAALADEAIILVGGRGTRLQSVVSDVPKPLAPVGGRPFLAWLLDLLRAQGMRRVILATGHMAKQVEAFVGSDWSGMDVDYSHETSPMGTGGAVQQAVARLQGESVHVLNGDTFLRYAPSGLVAATSRIGAGIGVALAHVDDVARYGAVGVHDGRVTGFQEKGGRGPGMINAGSYYFSRAGLALLGRATPFSLETEVLVPQAGVGNVAAFCETSGFIDIGVPEDYERAQRMFGAHA